MCVATPRPLSIDELVGFDIEADGEEICGTARVLRQVGYDRYGLRFERLLEPARRRLTQLAD
jgi:hypothetical protein